MRHIFPAVALALLSAACSTAPIVSPPGMQALTRAEDSAELTRQFFLGQRGDFFVAPATPDGPIFGLIQDPEEPGKAFLAGAGAERCWSEHLGLERSDRRVVKVTPVHLALGDLRHDGAVELYLVVDVVSEDQEGLSRLTRRAAYLFELARRANLLWYQTLRAEGSHRAPCQATELDYSSEVSFAADPEGRLDGIHVSFEVSRKNCKGGSKCARKSETCQRDHDDGERELHWDEELHTFAPQGTTQQVVTIPDVTL